MAYSVIAQDEELLHDMEEYTELMEQVQAPEKSPSPDTVETVIPAITVAPYPSGSAKPTEYPLDILPGEQYWAAVERADKESADYIPENNVGAIIVIIPGTDAEAGKQEQQTSESGKLSLQEDGIHEHRCDDKGENCEGEAKPPLGAQARHEDADRKGNGDYLHRLFDEGGERQQYRADNQAEELPGRGDVRFAREDADQPRTKGEGQAYQVAIDKRGGIDQGRKGQAESQRHHGGTIVTAELAGNPAHQKPRDAVGYGVQELKERVELVARNELA